MYINLLYVTEYLETFNTEWQQIQHFLHSFEKG